MSGYRVGIVGATGVVGREALRVLRERNFPASALRLFASARSAGMRIGSLVVEAASRAAFHDLDLIIFDTPDEVARELVPSAAAAGALVIDNSAAFRMEPDVPLVIPEVNADALRQIPRRIIANPNCTTATIAVPLAPLHRAAGVRRRSEEHTSELQSRLHLVCRLLLEKKKDNSAPPGSSPASTFWSCRARLPAATAPRRYRPSRRRCRSSGSTYAAGACM